MKSTSKVPNETPQIKKFVFFTGLGEAPNTNLSSKKSQKQFEPSSDRLRSPNESKSDTYHSDADTTPNIPIELSRDSIKANRTCGRSFSGIKLVFFAISSWCSVIFVSDKHIQSKPNDSTVRLHHQQKDFLGIIKIQKKINMRDFEVPTSCPSFIMCSNCEDNIYRSIKYGIWSSSQNGQSQISSLNSLFVLGWLGSENIHKEWTHVNGRHPIFLFFKATDTKRFCGVACLKSDVDFDRSFNGWKNNRLWNGVMKIDWIFVKDIRCDDSVFDRQRFGAQRRTASRLYNGEYLHSDETRILLQIFLTKVRDMNSTGASILQDCERFERLEKKENSMTERGFNYDPMYVSKSTFIVSVLIVYYCSASFQTNYPHNYHSFDQKLRQSTDFAEDYSNVSEIQSVSELSAVSNLGPGFGGNQNVCY